MPATNVQTVGKILAFSPRPEHRPVVILAERDPEVLHQTETMLVATGHTVIASGCPQDVEDILGRRKIDAVFAGLDFAHNSNRELIRRIRVISPTTPLIFIRSDEPVEQVVSAMKDGAETVLQHPLSADQLLEAMSRAREANEENRARRELRRSTDIRMTTLLTLAEREIIQLYAEGLEAQEVALEMGISHRALRLARQELLAKLSARTMCEALRIVFSR